MENQLILSPALAELTLAGVNKLVGIKHQPMELVNRLLVISSGPVFDYEMPVEFIMEGHNQIVFGNIPPINKMAKDAVVGVVELGWKEEGDVNPLWRNMLQGDLYHVLSCYVFNVPVNLSLVEKLNLTADDLLRALPFHFVDSIYGLADLSKTLLVNLGSYSFGMVDYLHALTLDLTPQVKEVVLDENENIKDFKYLLLTFGNEEKRYEFKAHLKVDHNTKEEPVLYNSVLEPCGKNIRRQIVLDCSSQLFW